MIKDNQRLLNRMHVVLDILVIVSSWAISWLIIILTSPGAGILPTGVYFSFLLPVVPSYLLLYWSFRLYEPKRTRSKRLEAMNIIKANILGLLIFSSILFTLRKSGYFAHFSTRMLALFFVFTSLFTIIERWGIRFCLSYMRKKGFNQKHVMLVGFSDASSSFIDAIKRNPEWGYTVFGILDDLVPSGTSYREIKVIGKIDELEKILSDNAIDEIAITLPLQAYSKLGRIVNICEKSGVHTKFIPDYNNVIHSRPVTEDMDGLPVIHIRNVPLTDPLRAFLKRTVDIIGAVFGLIIFSPVMLITAILIKSSSKGKVIFSQERVGLHNRPFMMYKFRSMVEQSPEDEKKGWTVKNDPRVTRVGSFIRKTSIDELPQFFNVLKGDMSLVGPRPERTQFVEMFREEIPRYMVKHQVRPGITGWAQVNGFRGDTSIPDRIKYDLWYIENWTMGLDIKIMLLTVLKGFVNKNAY